MPASYCEEPNREGRDLPPRCGLAAARRRADRHLGDADLTLPTAKAGGFSVQRHVPAFAGLTVSPRAFYLSVCPAARCSDSGVSRRAEMFQSAGLVIANTCYDTRVHAPNQYRSPYIPMPKGRGFTATFGNPPGSRRGIGHQLRSGRLGIDLEIRRGSNGGWGNPERRPAWYPGPALRIPRRSLGR